MFSGIIETTGIVKKIEQEGSNKHFFIESNISNQLKIDQSVSHQGVCLTVVDLAENWHKVTAVEETLIRSSLGALETGSPVNLERSVMPTSRLDGHMVQGHVDQTAICTRIDTLEGSWYFHFEYESSPEHILVDKGSISVDGVSLTVVNPTKNTFSVAIIPYTFEHTSFGSLQVGDKVNIEFDIIGKYIAKYMETYRA